MNTLKQLSESGQSPWYDNIKKSLLTGGGLEKMIKEGGILGVTSNPTIFEKAINSSSEYDEDILALVKSEREARDIYDELTIKDISMAADILRKVFKASRRTDGYVSIEVLPEYAHDAAKTIEDAKRIFHRIGKENIMIKVPGTIEAYDAIRTLTGEGINVNVTLLFSVAHYERIAKAYIDGLKDRLKAGGDLSTVNSVASVFISRIDTKIDKMLEGLSEKEKDKEESLKIASLRGKAAIANAKMVYQSFKELFSDRNFGALKAKGAHVQRVLWASTSTKNPSYNDVKYVEGLIGKNTINTIPDVTLSAFRDHGYVAVTVEERLDNAVRVLDELAFLGIDINAICQEAQDEGLAAFQASFDNLIASIESKIGLKAFQRKEDLIRN